MSGRDLPAEFHQTKYIDGFLHDRALKEGELKYGYCTNHLPETSGRSREMASVLDNISP
ncbi:MAG TPA: hypothetical protein VNW15_12615 [Rhizomicrobium sp.]|jgi:hypothetical protein|nr:hypothetical protein [Rhizomicrobium sp.]